MRRPSIRGAKKGKKSIASASITAILFLSLLCVAFLGIGLAGNSQLDASTLDTAADPTSTDSRAPEPPIFGPGWEVIVSGKATDGSGDALAPGHIVEITSGESTYYTQTLEDGYYYLTDVPVSSGEDILASVVVGSDSALNVTRASTGIAYYTLDLSLPPTQTGGGSAPFDYFPFLMLGFIGTLGLASAVGIEVLKLALISLVIPLYTRLKKESVLENYTRGRLYQHIEMNPGEHFNALLKVLSLSNGQLAYHLSVLERMEKVKSRNEGIFKRYYPANVPLPVEDGGRLSEIQKRIVNHVRDLPGVSQKEMANLLGIKRSTLNYQVNVLQTRGFIKADKQGRRMIYFLADDYDEIYAGDT